MEQLDGLYPEWDEFYLLVCEYCGIIIRPQALKKHLASKHRIVHLQHQPQQQTQQQQQPQQQIPSQPQKNGPKYQPNGTNSIPKPMDIDITTATTTTTTLTNTPTTIAETNSTSNNNNNNSTTTNTYTMQQIPSRLWGGKHALDSLPKPAIQRRPCDWVKVRRATTPLLHAMRNWL